MFSFASALFKPDQCYALSVQIHKPKVLPIRDMVRAKAITLSKDVQKILNPEELSNIFDLGVGITYE